jgi:N-glycosylase/DNA lyase
VQYVSHGDGTGYRVLALPDSNVEVLPGTCWGKVGDYFTPAFWKAIAWKQGSRYMPSTTGGSLREELAACMLCGYGVPSELGRAAFRRLINRGLLGTRPDPKAVEASLTEPLEVGGRQCQYRFYRSKARALVAAMERFDDLIILPCDTPSEIRGRLLALPGVGPKTASYVVRNFFASDDVAILDVHITRASIMMRIFPEGANPQRDYFTLEKRFLEFARAIEVKPSVLDNLIWHGMRTLDRVTRSTIR